MSRLIYFVAVPIIALAFHFTPLSVVFYAMGTWFTVDEDRSINKELNEINAKRAGFLDRASKGGEELSRAMAEYESQQNDLNARQRRLNERIASIRRTETAFQVAFELVLAACVGVLLHLILRMTFRKKAEAQPTVGGSGEEKVAGADSMRS